MKEARDSANTPELVREQAELVTLMEASIDPDVLAAVESAYHSDDNDHDTTSMDVSYEGTIHA